MKRKRLNGLIKNRINSKDCVFEIWRILEDDLIYLIGIYPGFDSQFEIGDDFVSYYYFNNLDIIMQKQIENYSFKNELLKNLEIVFEIEMTYKHDDAEYLSQIHTSSDLNIEISDQSKTLKIFLNALILGNFTNIKKIKKEIILALTGEIQESLNLKKNKIKNSNLITLDCLFEEILALIELENITFQEAKQEIILYHKDFFNKWSLEKMQTLTNDLDELYELLNV